MSYAVSRNLKLVTNDLSSQYDSVGITDYAKLPENKKRIPLIVDYFQKTL